MPDPQRLRRLIDDALAPEGTTSAAPIPCFQCGVCCVRWQPLLGPPELRRVAAGLGLSVRTFNRRYTRPYPLRRGWRQLLTGATGGCVFLEYRDGRSRCSIYATRPEVCREWQAGLDRRECKQGLRLIGDDGPLTPEALYPSSREDQLELAAAVSPDRGQACE